MYDCLRSLDLEKCSFQSDQPGAFPMLLRMLYFKGLVFGFTLITFWLNPSNLTTIFTISRRNTKVRHWLILLPQLAVITLPTVGKLSRKCTKMCENV